MFRLERKFAVHVQSFDGRPQTISLGVEDGILQAYNPDFELQFSHRVSQMTRFSQADLDPTTFLYLLRDDTDQLLYCYLFQAKKPSDVSELYKQMKEQTNATPTRSSSSAANLTSLCVDISPSLSNFFEVLYIGKIKVWHRKVPDTFIDDALEKFRAHEMDKSRIKMLGAIGRLKSDDCLRRSSIESTGSDTSSVDSSSTSSQSQRHPHQLQRSCSTVSYLSSQRGNTNQVSSAADSDDDSAFRRRRPEDIQSSSPPIGRPAVDMEDHNRTMVLQVDRTDLRLISPDRKIILLHKHHKDVTTCVQGSMRSEHFGFICREGCNVNTYVGYVFKCESLSIASDAVSAITQAFSYPESRPRATITSCEHCPMVFFHKLCAEVEHLSDRKTQAAIFRKLEQLDEEEQNVILTKFRGAETDSVREQNEFLMMLLRAHCEMKQGRHLHDSLETRSSEVLSNLSSGTIFTKAKRSLSNSFDQLLKRKSNNDFGPTLREMNLPLNRANSPASIAETSDRESEGSRSRSSTIGSNNDLREHLQHLSVKDNVSKHSVSPERSINSDKGPKSPMMDIFLKVGNSPKNTISEENSCQKMDTGSWRQAIFKRVITPNKNDKPDENKQRTKEELRALWQKSIQQAILLVRMEKENAKLKAEQEESAVKRIKLEYDEMKQKQCEVMDVWEMITNKDNRIKCDKQILLGAIRQGVPRGKRGEVWQYLAEQYSSQTPPVDLNKHPNYNVPYDTLLKQLTSHQHAILIDLGRTFPNHSYFSSPLGPGQLALFNLLKAYSLLDPEVGYCQGLSFVAGVLLLHMEESQAFFLLRHLMFSRDLRKQYLPDMNGLQIKLYQISRLLHDQLPDLYEHFDFYEVAPTLYAAPWLLTIFASQFPLGFVTRVFDLLFLESPDVIFKIALALLTCHKDNLMACDSFEEIMKYMKNKLSSVDKPMLDQIMKQIFTTDISKQLNEYLVEYNVLQEEMVSVQPQVDALHKLENQNKTLTGQNKTLLARIDEALANQQRLEKSISLQQDQITRLEMQNRGLEVTVSTLAGYINALVDHREDIHVPDQVNRALAQITLLERKKVEFKPQNNFIKMFQKPYDQDKIMVKSYSTGKLSMPTSFSNSELKTTSNKSLTPETRRQSSFFSNTHNNGQQRVYGQGSSLLSNAKVDITIQEADNEMNTKNNNNNDNMNNNNNNEVISSKNYEQSNGNVGGKGTFRTNTINLPLNENRNNVNDNTSHSRVSPTSSIDSGISTPGSPKNQDTHPLSNCDVNFSYATRELKHIRSLRNYTRNSSPDMLSK